MKTFQKHLDEKLKDPEFKELYDAEKKLLDLSLRLIEERKRKGYSQKELANRAKITQQQLSKIENGYNCNMITFLKVSKALGKQIEFS